MANESSTTKTYFWYEIEKKLNAFAKKIKFDQWKGWIYLSPAIVLLLVFTVWPIINTLIMAFSEDYTDYEMHGSIQKLVSVFDSCTDIDQAYDILKNM